jgi:hypothetical protein
MSDTSQMNDDKEPYNLDQRYITDLTNRLRGKYPCGPLDEEGNPEFGYRQFGQEVDHTKLGFVSPIQKEAADIITVLWNFLHDERIKNLGDIKKTD